MLGLNCSAKHTENLTKRNLSSRERKKKKKPPQRRGQETNDREVACLLTHPNPMQHSFEATDLGIGHIEVAWVAVEMWRLSAPGGAERSEGSEKEKSLSSETRIFVASPDMLPSIAGNSHNATCVYRTSCSMTFNRRQQSELHGLWLSGP